MTSNRGRRRSIFSIWSLLLFVAMGCGGDSGLSEHDYDNDYTGPRASDEYLMVPAGAPVIEGEVTGSVTVEVYLYEKATGKAAENREVSFEVLAEEDDAGAPSLDMLAAFTDANGAARVTAFLGTETGEWEVRASSASSNSVTFEVISYPVETGSIAVELVNVAPTIMTLSDVDVRVYRSDRFDCEYFRPLLFQEPTFLAEAYSPFTEETVHFHDLGTRHHYTVTAIARGEHGQVAAGGCINMVGVQKDQVTNLEMLLQLVPLNPVGTYDVISHWDFSDAIADSGAVGSIIVRVLNVFDNPGLAIYNEIIALISNLVGGLISASIDTFLDLTGLDTAFQNMINNFIEGNAVLVQIRDAGRDLRDVIANLQVHSELSIGKMSSDFEFRGQDNWLGITLYWRWNCGPADGPECGAIELVPDADGTFAELGVLSSNWTGRVVAYDQIQIDQHTVSLRYGRLIIYIINDVILPAVTDGNATSMSQAFGYWLGCQSLVDSVMPNGELCAAGYCLQSDPVVNFCESAVSTIFGFADLLINSLEFDMGLRLGGSARLVEETSDGIVDRIDMGVFQGVIESDGGQQSSPFTADFAGVRQVQ